MLHTCPLGQPHWQRPSPVAKWQPGAGHWDAEETHVPALQQPVAQPQLPSAAVTQVPPLGCCETRMQMPPALLGLKQQTGADVTVVPHAWQVLLAHVSQAQVCPGTTQTLPCAVSQHSFTCGSFGVGSELHGAQLPFASAPWQPPAAAHVPSDLQHVFACAQVMHWPLLSLVEHFGVGMHVFPLQQLPVVQPGRQRPDAESKCVQPVQG